MKAEILSVGTELLLGDIVNTNAAFLSRKCAELGITIYNHTVVGDNPKRLKSALEIAFNRSDLVVLTGGLGPTYDDLTKETVAEYFQIPMVHNQMELDKITAYFHRLGTSISGNNKKQAYIPKDATLFCNDFGTASGICLQKDKKIAILLPGPPSEMEAMFTTYVSDYLKSLSNTTLLSKNIKIFGIGEAEVEERLYDLMLKGENPTVAPYAKDGEVLLRVTACASSTQQATVLLNPVMQQIQSEIGQFIYGVDVENLEQVLVQKLISLSKKIATAESCTGGLLSKRITDIPNSSQVLEGGICSYSNRTKTQLLGVPADLIENFGAVSEQVALAMAQAIRNITNADIGISSTGIAGPDGGTQEKPVGLVYVAICADNYTKVLKLSLNPTQKSDRQKVRYLACSHALHLVLDYLKTLE
ncbi:MAG: competence/damage-inducible protein A [Oscillospiraceae bacterium]